MSNPLPSSRGLITALIESAVGNKAAEAPSLRHCPSTRSDNRDSGLPTDFNPRILVAARAALLTLHVLFQDELLAALDLLDRRLVKKVLVGDVRERLGGKTAFYQVISSRQPRSGDAKFSITSSRHAYSTITAHYEVRLTAWNCSCPAFTYAACSDTALDDGFAKTTGAQDGDLTRGLKFGGVSIGDSVPPVCKHLLACALAENWPFLADMVEEIPMCREEAAGWIAGWGG